MFSNSVEDKTCPCIGAETKQKNQEEEDELLIRRFFINFAPEVQIILVQVINGSYHMPCGRGMDRRCACLPHVDLHLSHLLTRLP